MEVSGKKGFIKKCSILCQPCKDRALPTRSDGFCTRCGEHMCKPCFDIHKQFKLNRGHTLADTSESVVAKEQDNDLEACAQHYNEFVKFYCSEHEQVGCGDCMIFEHKTCKVEYISGIGKTFKDSYEFKEFVKGVEKCHLQVKEIAISIKNNKIQASDINKTFVQDVHAFSEDIISQINKHKKSVIRQAEALKSKDIENMDKLEKENEELIKMTRLTELYESHTDKPYKLFVSYVLQKPKLKRLQATHDCMKKRNSIKNYQFKPDVSLECSVKECQQLGTIQETGEKVPNSCDDECHEGLATQKGKMQGQVLTPQKVRIQDQRQVPQKIELPGQVQSQMNVNTPFRQFLCSYQNMPPYGMFPMGRQANFYPYHANNSGINIPFPPGMMPYMIDPQTGKFLQLPGYPNIPAHQSWTPGRQLHGPLQDRPPYNTRNVEDDRTNIPRTDIREEGYTGESCGEEYNHDQGEPTQEPVERPTKIIVSKLPSSAHDEYLEMYFENTKKFGGGPVRHVELGEDENSAVIEFEDPDFRWNEFDMK